MKLPIAVFTIVLGYKDGDMQTDNWSSRKIQAKTATDAIKKVKLNRGEYIAQAILHVRLD